MGKPGIRVGRPAVHADAVEESGPLRYMHSVVEMADLRDVEKTIELIARFVESVTDDDDFAHKL